MEVACSSKGQHSLIELCGIIPQNTIQYRQQAASFCRSWPRCSSCVWKK